MKPNSAAVRRLATPVLEGRQSHKMLVSQASREVNSISVSGTKEITDVVSHDSSVAHTLSTLRQFLGSNIPQQRDAVQKLDEIVNHIQSELMNMTADEKLRIIGAFEGLLGYTVHNRIHDRYNTKPLLYQNRAFYSELVKSFDWATVYSSTPLSRTRTLSPLLSIVRSINRMGLPSSLVQSVLTQLLSDVIANLPREPKQVHLVELVSICSKNKLVHQDLFAHVIGELSMNFNAFHEDLLGDLLRSFTNLNYANPDFYATLELMLPTRVHELAWWNLVDLGDFYATCTPRDSPDMISRISNEIWKWIPDMRSGYAAKALRVLSQLDSGDERTRRSLIRVIPKSLGKMHPHVAAETLIAAAKVNYMPRFKYGKRHGSVFYRRVAARLLGDNTDASVNPLEKVSPGLIVQVLESLAKIDRPIPELFDAIIEDYKRGKKYSLEQLVTIEKILCDKFDYEVSISKSREIDQSLSTSSLAYLARSDDSLIPHLFDQSDVTVADVVGLIHALPGSDRVVKFAQSEWLDKNLTAMSSDDFKSFVCALAQRGVLDSTCLALLAMNTNSFSHYESLSSAVETVSSMFILSDYDFSLISDKVWKQVTCKPVLDLRTISLCQLICGHMRLSSSPLTDSMSRFCQWIESHLISKNGHLISRESDGFETNVPLGWVKELSVFPVVIPVALPNSDIDVRSLHGARNPTMVRRICKSNADSGIAVFRPKTQRDLVGSMQESYLTKLGWKVYYANPDSNMSESAHLSGASCWD